MDAHELNDCFIAAVTERCRYIPGASVTRSRGLVCAFSQCALPSSYCVVSSAVESHADFADRLDAAFDEGRRHGASWDLVILADWLDAAGDGADAAYAAELDARGLRYVATMHGLEADELAPPRRAAPALTIRRAAGADGLRALAAINNAAYGFDPAADPELYLAYLRAPQACAFLGVEDDEPIACAAAFPIAHGIYLGAVATRSDRRGRGYAETLIRHTVRCARQETGLTRTVLFASRRRAPFYAPLGFATRATLRVYRT